MYNVESRKTYCDLRGSVLVNIFIGNESSASISLKGGGI